MPDTARATYLLRDGRALASDRPLCFERMAPAEGAAPGGLWAEAPDADDGDPRRRRVVAWLSPADRPADAARRLHVFRQAVLQRYPGATFRAYPAAEPPTPRGRP
jgi:hypothetical protein